MFKPGLIGDARARARGAAASAPGLSLLVADHSAPSLAFRMDEAAAAIHIVAPVKVGLNVVGGLMAALVLPWRVCVLWVLVGVALEAWGWFATRAQAQARAIGAGARGNFVATFVAQNLCWLLLGALLWNEGSLAGRTTGAVMMLSLASVFVLLFYNTPVVFLLAGAIPAIAALTVIVLDDRQGWRELAPLAIALGLSLVFTLGRALDTPSAQASRRRLDDSLDQYRTLADNVTDIVSRVDMAGVYQYTSPACLAVLGYAPEVLIGTPIRDLIDPDCLADMEAVLGRLLADADHSQVMTVRVRHKDGHWIWLQTSIKLVREGGVPVAMIGASRDVTERVATDAALLAAKAEAESASRAKAEFLANVSHEIRTPMNGILSALHLLEPETISTEGRELMRQAGDCGRILSQLLNDVLDFSKIEAGQMDLSPEPTQGGEALRSVVALLKSQARDKGVALTCEISDPDLWIQADPLRLRQAMFNLVGNAVKFTACGHVVARLTVRPGAEGQRCVRLEVEDTGIGMSAQAQVHLFERFRQAESDTARRFGGTGLGLAITQALVRQMGGDIGVVSIEGQGSTFWLEFEAPAAQVTLPAPAEDGLLDGLNILVVEDNPTNRLMVRTLLTRLGAKVREAEDGVAGLEAARIGEPDIILMDIQMPLMDGVQATRAIRALPGAAGQVPIIALTANVMVHQRSDYLAAGMNGVVSKPITAAALLGEISRLVVEAETRLAG